MTSLRFLRSLFVVAADNPELTRSQFVAFTKQLPLLYFILVANTVSASVTHLDSAPLWMSVWLPAGLCAVCLGRMAVWMVRRHQPVTDAEAVRRLRGTVVLAPVLGLIFTTWALCLFQYGDAYAQCHVAFFIAMTVIGCIFCLMHVRAAALLLTLIVIVPFAVFFAQTGRIVLIAMAVNIVLAAGAMIFILMTHYRDFATLIESQKNLLLKQRETLTLSNENVRIANRDSLTDLPNRRSFFAELTLLLDRAGATGSRFAVGLIDLDGFKPVNDIYGHAAGDRVLIEATRRLQALASDGISFARLGGDEFGLIVDCAAASGDLMQVGHAVCRALGAPYALPDITAELSASLGMAVFPQAGTTVETLFERADYALYHAKQHLRGTAVIFSAEHETKIREISILEQELRQADLDREMSLAYQPITDVRTGRTIAFEALARWTSPTRGVVRPDIFIGVAERSGLINRLTLALLRQALATARGWPAEVGISFNLSARDLASSEAIRTITALVSASGIDPGRIHFEVTETMVMRDFDQGCEALQALRRLGVGISLDDFGTGYSSLSYVHRLPIDKIKVDRSFVADIELSASSRNIVRTVVGLCRNLGLDCVIEGVETAVQSRILQELGCVMMQGYLFAKPMPAAAVAAHLAGQEEALPDLSRTPAPMVGA